MSPDTTQAERDAWQIECEATRDQENLATVARHRQRAFWTKEAMRKNPRRYAVDFSEACRIAHFALYALNNPAFGTYRAYDGTETPKVGPHVSDAARFAYHHFMLRNRNPDLDPTHTINAISDIAGLLDVTTQV